MKRVRAVVAGTGFGGRVILPALAAIREIEIAALCGGSDAEKTGRLARRFGVPARAPPFREICRRGDAALAFVASPHEHHAGMARDALNAGLHVVCEKPLALREAEVADLVARARRAGTVCLVDHQLRFHPAVRGARDAIRAGRIGRCVHAWADYRTNRYVDPAVAKHAWWFDPVKGGGMFWAMGTHLVDLLRFCLGAEPVTVLGCVADPVLPSVTGPGGTRIPVRAESMFAGRMEFAGGVHVLLQATGVAFAEASGLTVVFRGDRGELTLESPGRLTVSDTGARRGSMRTLRRPGAGETNLFETAFREFARVLVRALVRGRPDLLADACTFEAYAPAHRAVCALRASAARGAPAAARAIRTEGEAR